MNAKRPIIDKTEASRGCYLVGEPCGPSFGHGRPVTATKTTEGWNVSAASDDDAARLLAYLTGPRRIQLSIWSYAPLAAHGTLLTEHEMHVSDGPDNPENRQGWNLWTEKIGKEWLADRFPNGLKPGHYYMCAADLDIAHCAGSQGLWGLGDHEFSVPA